MDDINAYEDTVKAFEHFFSAGIIEQNQARKLALREVNGLLVLLDLPKNQLRIWARPRHVS